LSIVEEIIVQETHLKKGQIGLYLDDKGFLLPLDAVSADRYMKLKRGEPYVFTFKRSRNYMFHRKYFSLLNLAFSNQEKFAEFEWFRKWTLIAIGECKTYIDPFTGKISNEAVSVSFDKCSEDDFDNIYSKTVTFFIEKFCFDDDFFNKLRSYDG